MKLFLCNLHFSISEVELRARVETFGTVHWLLLIRDRETGKSKGYGFVDMPRAEASAAIASLDGKWIKGRKLVVKESLSVEKDQDEHGQRAG